MTALHLTVGALLGLAALASYVRLLRRRLSHRPSGAGPRWTLVLGSWLVVGVWIASARLLGVQAVWAAAGVFLVGHRVWLRGQVRSLSAEKGTP